MMAPHALRRRSSLPVALAWTLLLVPSVGSSWAAAPELVGDEFQVNTYTTYEQRDAEVAMDSAGRFTVVWEEGSYIELDPPSVRARRFDDSPPAPRS